MGGFRLTNLLCLRHTGSPKRQPVPPSAEEMAKQMTKWESDRNASGLGAQWRFTTADARITLRKLYPVECDIKR